MSFISYIARQLVAPSSETSPLSAAADQSGPTFNSSGTARTPAERELERRQRSAPSLMDALTSPETKTFQRAATRTAPDSRETDPSPTDKTDQSGCCQRGDAAKSIKAWIGRCREWLREACQSAEPSLFKTFVKVFSPLIESALTIADTVVDAVSHLLSSTAPATTTRASEAPPLSAPIAAANVATASVPSYAPADGSAVVIKFPVALFEADPLAQSKQIEATLSELGRSVAEDAKEDKKTTRGETQSRATR